MEYKLCIHLCVANITQCACSESGLDSRSKKREIALVFNEICDTYSYSLSHVITDT